MVRVVAGLIGLVSLAVAGVAGGLTPEVAIQFTGVSDIALSPDGTRAVYLLSVPRDPLDAPGDDYHEIWTLGIDPPQPPRRLTAPKGNPSSPEFSPDGQTISFVDQRDAHNKKKQVFLLPMNGGEARGLTTHKAGVGAYHWSPDGQWIAFIAKEPLSEEEQADKDDGRDWTIVGESDRGGRLWLTRVSDGETAPALDSPLVIRDFCWTPDSQGFVIRATEQPGVDQDMMYSRLYHATRAEKTPTLVCETAGKLGPFTASSDGAHLAYLGAADISDPLPQTLFVVDLPQGEPRSLSGEREASGVALQWLSESELAVLWHAGEKCVMERTDVASGKSQPLAEAEVAISRFAIAGDHVIVSGSTPTTPSALFVSTSEGSLVKATSHNDVLTADVDVARREVIEWKGADNWPIYGVLTYPLGYKTGETYPLVVYPHGGPEGVSLLDWSDRAQMLAARGFAVLQPNYRGSGGRGVRFSKGDHDDLGGREFDDILAGIDMLATRGMIDPQR
ncbi:MAG: S9 family peptidase, partial [Phycisphaerales bacterium]|nr:S9 family peptidase [Phycisphaerales bacterium]